MPRWAHRFYAAAFGYFWMPCRRCGRFFGGHEAVAPKFSFITDGTRPIVCPGCTCAVAAEDRVRYAAYLTNPGRPS